MEKYIIMEFAPCVTIEEIQRQWTLNKCMSFLMRKHFFDKRPSREPLEWIYPNWVLYVYEDIWIELEIESKPLEGIFRILFFNVIFF